MRSAGSFLLVLFCILFCTMNGQIPYAVRIDSAACAKRKKENVKSVYRFTQTYDSIKGVLPKKAHADTLSYSTYDREGRETELCLKTGHLERHVWFTYDLRGHLTRKVSCNPDSSSGFIERYEYNDGGQLIKRITWSRHDRKDEVISVYVYFYDKQGRMSMQETFRDSADVPAGAYRQRMVYTYDKQDREILMLTFSLSGDTTYIDSTIYSRGNSYTQISYALSPQLVGGKTINVRRVVSFSSHHDDTLSNTISSAHMFEYFYGGNQAEKISTSDSTIRDMRGNVLVDYTSRNYTEYTYDKSGTFLYSIEYNPAHQPLLKETHVTLYYK